MSLDLEKLKKQLDKALESETTETLLKFLDEERAKINADSESCQVDTFVMCCNGCKYLGQRITHLDNFDGCEKWFHCKYPLPFHQSDKAVPGVSANDCKCKVKST